MTLVKVIWFSIVLDNKKNLQVVEIMLFANKIKKNGI